MKRLLILLTLAAAAVPARAAARPQIMRYEDYLRSPWASAKEKAFAYAIPPPAPVCPAEMAADQQEALLADWRERDHAAMVETYDARNRLVDALGRLRRGQQHWMEPFFPMTPAEPPSHSRWPTNDEVMLRNQYPQYYPGWDPRKSATENGYRDEAGVAAKKS